jgi:putative PIN family toxin of toxin-antitoxin system
VTAWRAVLDAQVWVSGAISRHGPARALLDEARNGGFRIVTSAYIQAEVREIFARPSVRRFLAPGFGPLEWLELVELCSADVVDSSEGPLLVAGDPDDDPYLWTAYVGAATHLVTWDAAVLSVKHYRGTQVVEPSSFLASLRARAR